MGRFKQLVMARLGAGGVWVALTLLAATGEMGAQKPRARDLGVPFAGSTGPLNAIPDVAGVQVGHVTLIRGQGPLRVGQGPVRTGVTAVLPRGRRYDPVFAGWFSLNGNGEMTGTTWIEESGFLEGPILITNTHSVGVARDAVVAWMYRHRLYDPLRGDVFWALPVVAETYDGILNDINGFHVRSEHVMEALDGAREGPVAEGNVGGGTGMICHGFKGGSGLLPGWFRRRGKNTVGGPGSGQLWIPGTPHDCWGPGGSGNPGPSTGPSRLRSRRGFHHRHRSHRRSLNAAPAEAPGPAGSPGNRPRGGDRSQHLRRHLSRLFHSQSRCRQANRNRNLEDAAR